MTNYYVGIGGDNGNAGTSWAARKLTLNGAEDIPVAAGDTVYVGPGTYREMLTCDVSGSSGSPITYIGDYTGANTDGTGGVVRITGSDNDQSATRANSIIASGKNYRTFRGFLFDTATARSVDVTNGSDWIIDQCVFGNNASDGILFGGASSLRGTVSNCFHYGRAAMVIYYNGSDVDDSGHSISNCIGIGYAHSDSTLANIQNFGGITIKNCFARGYYRAINLAAAPAAGQTITVNNCIFDGNSVALYAVASSFLIEDYNSLYGNATARTNVDVGANSNTYPALTDMRWFFELVNGGDMLSPFDLASYSQLVNVAGTSPTTADMRGTTVQGAQREWGALEYDSTLDIEAGSGGGISRARIIGGV